jgi:hypothetical protein
MENRKKKEKRIRKKEIEKEENKTYLTCYLDAAEMQCGQHTKSRTCKWATRGLNHRAKASRGKNERENYAGTVLVSGRSDPKNRRKKGEHLRATLKL